MAPEQTESLQGLDLGARNHPYITSPETAPAQVWEQNFQPRA